MADFVFAGPLKYVRLNNLVLVPPVAGRDYTFNID